MALGAAFLMLDGAAAFGTGAHRYVIVVSGFAVAVAIFGLSTARDIVFEGLCDGIGA
jgi:hypothetical protein